jgi:hypothetical protein
VPLVLQAGQQRLHIGSLRTAGGWPGPLSRTVQAPSAAATPPKTGGRQSARWPWGLQGLDGLRSMVPDGEFLTELNAGAANVHLSYFALKADYEPPELGFRTFRDVIMGKILGAENAPTYRTRSPTAAA